MCALNKIAVVLMYIFKVTPTIFIMFAALLSMRGTDFVGMPSMEPSHTTCHYLGQPMDRSERCHSWNQIPPFCTRLKYPVLLCWEGWVQQGRS